MEIKIKGLDDISRAASEFIEQIGERKVFAFHGEMGVGKTTFISEVCRQLGVRDLANSPSFSIVNEYESETDGSLIYHFDFYRLDSPSEALEIGVDDYFYSGSLCLVEWPEMIGSLLPDEVVDVTVSEDFVTGERTICIE